MGSIARSVVDTILGEAVAGSRSARFEDMMAIASTIANRAAATGVSMQDIVSAPNQYSAYGKSLPPGVERYRDLAIAALEQVQTKGPVTTAQYYATPSATKNLPSGLTPVAQTKGHQFFVDPAARPMVTAVGVKQPGQVAFDVVPDQPAVQADVLDSIFGLGTAPTAQANRAPRDIELDSIFGLEPAASPAPAPNRASDLDAVFGFTPATAAATAGTGLALSAMDDGPTAEWDGTFSNPLGAITDRTTSDFGLRDAVETSLGISSTNHAGIDLSAERGQTGYAANATGPGVVTHAGPLGGYGMAVTVEHPNGFTSVYGHLQDIGVRKGDEIAKNTPVGTVGRSGNVSGAHLHFEMRDPLGQPVNPRDVVDMSLRDTVTPSPRGMSPTEQRAAASAYSGLAASLASAGVAGVGRTAPASTGLPAGFDMARFAGDVQPSRAADVPSSASTQVAAFAGGQPSRSAPASMPGPERFGRVTTDIDPARFGPSQPAASRPSAERFGRTASPSLSVTGPFSPADDYAVATAPTSAPRDMASTQKAGRLSSTVTPSNATPMASIKADLTAGPTSFDLTGLPTANARTASVAPSSMGLLPSTSKAPAGPFSSFTSMPLDLNVIDPVNSMKANRLSINMPAIPTVAPPVVQPMITPTVSRQISRQTTSSIPAPAPKPSFSALDVYSGRAPAGYQAPASGGNLVSRDAFGNTSVTNQFGVTTVTDPSGRQMGNLGGLGDLGGIGKSVGAMADKVSPGMVGSLIGGAIAGMPGAIVGGIIGGKLGGKAGGTQVGQKSGGLGGLGGFFAGLFGGGSSSSGGKGGGGSSSSGSRGGNSSGGGFSPPGADRSQAGNN
jgi:murein DD-endopeptidase MepM/ murein hydrolase activator NlpD